MNDINLILPAKILKDINFRRGAKRLIDGEDVHRFDELHIHDHVDIVIFILLINFDKGEAKFKWVYDDLCIADWLPLLFIVFQHQVAVIFDLGYHFVSEGVVFGEVVDVFFQRYVFPYLVDILSAFVILKHLHNSDGQTYIFPLINAAAFITQRCEVKKRSNIST